MAQRRHHYESAFEQYLRTTKVPYVAVDEAKKALLPGAVDMYVVEQEPASNELGDERLPHVKPRKLALKSFDFVIYGEGLNLLCEVKGRRISLTRKDGVGRLENWVTMDDVESLTKWERLFGAGFEAAFIFVYWCDAQPPDGLFQEIFTHKDKWYALRACRLRDYKANMRVRSPKWRTLDILPKAFQKISHPFAPPRANVEDHIARGMGRSQGDSRIRSTRNTSMPNSLDEPIQSLGITLPSIDRIASLADWRE